MVLCCKNVKKLKLQFFKAIIFRFELIVDRFCHFTQEIS